MFLKIIIICLIAIIIFILSFFLGCHLNKKHEEHNASVNFTASIHTTTILNTTANTVATEEEKTEKEKEQEEKSEEQEDKNEEKANPQVEAITSVVEVKTSITENKVPVTEEKESKKCNCCIIKTLLSVLLFIGIYFALILILPTSSFETLVFIFIAYLLFVLVVKSLIGAIVTRKEKDTLFHYKSVFDIPDTFYLLSFLFISPDYYITYLIKAKIEGIEKNDNGETAKQLRSVYIQANNIFNIIFTCLLAILSYVWIQCGLGNVITLYYILFVRIVSRTIEIILSFVLDVIYRHRKSLIFLSGKVRSKPFM